MKTYKASTERNTKETKIAITVDFSDGAARNVDTGIPFFDHLLQAMAFHGGFGLEIKATGDLQVDPHHCVEDVGIVLGDALREMLASAGAVERYGHSVIPMDDSLSEVTIDVCERPYLMYSADYPQPRCGDFDVSLIREFLLGLANRARINLHASCRYGENSHHMAEALFKALGRAIKTAYNPKVGGKEAMSTKGSV
jgi:imidazoleglycerol-phosphate dehydratase